VYFIYVIGASCKWLHIFTHHIFKNEQTWNGQVYLKTTDVETKVL